MSENKKVINVDVIEPETNEEPSTNQKKPSIFDKALDMCGKAAEKVKDGAAYAYNHPKQTVAFIGTIWAGYKTVVRPVMRDIQEARDECKYYDRYGSRHVYECKRRLTNNEMYECDEYVKNGGSAYEWLRSHRIARK